jgi:hypothetical protein
MGALLHREDPLSRITPDHNRGTLSILNTPSALDPGEMYSRFSAGHARRSGRGEKQGQADGQPGQSFLRAQNPLPTGRELSKLGGVMQRATWSFFPVSIALDPRFQPPGRQRGWLACVGGSLVSTTFHVSGLTRLESLASLFWNLAWAAELIASCEKALSLGSCGGAT